MITLDSAAGAGEEKRGRWKGSRSAEVKLTRCETTGGSFRQNEEIADTTIAISARAKRGGSDAGPEIAIGQSRVLNRTDGTALSRAKSVVSSRMKARRRTNGSIRARWSAWFRWICNTHRDRRKVVVKRREREREGAKERAKDEARREARYVLSIVLFISRTITPPLWYVRRRSPRVPIFSAALATRAESA